MNGAYRYALLPPVEWPDGAEREIALQRDLWNRLVEIERQFQAAQHELLRRDPDFRALDDRLPAINDRLDAAYGGSENRAQPGGCCDQVLHRM